MKKLISVYLAAVLLVLCLPTVSAVGVTVKIAGSAIPYDSASGEPYLDNAVIMLPVERTMQYYGAAIERDAATGETLLKLGTKEVRLTEGSSTLIVNGCIAKLSTPIKKISGVLFAPARELVTALGGYCTGSGSTLDIDPQCADHEMVRLETTPNDPGNLWAKYNQAQEFYSAGKYSEAIPLFSACMYSFLSEAAQTGYTNPALLFGYLADCYARTGQYDRAAAAYSRSSYYWEKAGSTQTPLKQYECARAIRSELSMYLHTTDLTYSQEKTHGVRYEPERGIVLGYSTELGTNDTYPREAGMRLIYLGWNNITEKRIMDELNMIPENMVVEFAVHPTYGFDKVSDADVELFARTLESSGRAVMVRYANEMNEPTTPWYTDPATYKREYIRFANIMRQYAPSVPLIWAPNYWPMTNVDDYYPGDAYVDYVGVSSYYFSYHYSAAEKQYGYDVFGDGFKSIRWSQQLDFLYNHYGYKKPLIIAEGAASYYDEVSNQDVPWLAAEQIREFYTYLPMRYPNMKYAVYFNVSKSDEVWNWKLSDYPELIPAYLESTADDQFLSSYTDSSRYCYVPFETLNVNTELDPFLQELTSFVKYGKNTEVRSVRYEINGAAVGTAAAAPYKVSVDLSKYADQTITIRLVALDGSGKELSAKRFAVKVRGIPGKSGFYDVPDSQYYADPVLWAVQNGITAGMDPTHFAPSNGCTRGQVVTFLWRTAGQPAPESGNNPFTDVKSGKYYYNAVLWAVEKGITNGMSATAFQPDAVCNRGQIVTFLWRYAGKRPATQNTNPFTDVRSDAFYYDAVLWAVENKVTNGMTETTFEPNSTCTRGQVVTFLYRAAK